MAALPGEELALLPADIIGVWLFRLRGQGGLVLSTCDWIIRSDGTYTIEDKSGMHIEKGTFVVSRGKLVLDSDECYRNSSATFYHCVGTYTVFSRKEGGRPVQVRLVMVEDQGDRSVNFANKTFDLDPDAPPTARAASPAAAPAARSPVPMPTPAQGTSWSYVALGDSSSWGFPQYYAEAMEKDLGIKVQRLTRTVSGQTSAQLLKYLRETPSLRQEVSHAQVVTFYGNPLHLIGMRITGSASDPFDCSPQTVAAYKAEIGAIADEIMALRKGQPTIIRTYTRFMPFYRLWTEQGTEYRRCIAALDAAIMEVGNERGILVADVGLAINGPNRDQDPNDKGLLYDGVHENSEGSKVVAEVFEKLGYGGIIP
jgi:hypothetical protein